MPQSYTWPLATPAPAPTTSTPSQALPGASPPLRERRGLLRPLQRDGKGDLATVTGDDLLVARVRAVLGADTGYPWRHSFKARLERLRNQKNNPGLTAFAMFYCAEVVARWLPSVVVLRVDASRTTRSIELVVYVIRADDLRANPKAQGKPVSISIPTQPRAA